jgi:hypothetical protein
MPFFTSFVSGAGDGDEEAGGRQRRHLQEEQRDDPGPRRRLALPEDIDEYIAKKKREFVLGL